MSTALARYTVAQTDGDAEWDAGEVELGLWIGSLSAAEDAAQLTEHRISAVVTVAARLRPAVSSDISHTSIAIDDHPAANLFEALPLAFEAIDAVLLGQEGGDGGITGGVLVHCASGVSRSAATCVAWLMTRRQLGFEDALRQVRSARPRANPNVGFMRALEILETNEGNLDEASKKFLEVNPMELRLKQQAIRLAANALHSRADELEERLARYKSDCTLACAGEGAAGSAGLETPPELQCILVELEVLRKDIDTAIPEGGMDDRPARSIRIAACSKVARLLEQWVGQEQTVDESVVAAA